MANVHRPRLGPLGNDCTNARPTGALTLVSCCGPKLDRIAPARDLYRSPMFQKSARWAERKGDSWLVLSARHGLIRPDEMLEPYNQTLKAMTKAQRDAWARQVVTQMRSWASDRSVTSLHVTLLAGATYATWTPLAHDLARVVQPLQGMSIGYRLKWLTEQLADQSPLQAPAAAGCTEQD
jgi:hypothetical protein